MSQRGLVLYLLTFLHMARGGPQAECSYREVCLCRKVSTFKICSSWTSPWCSSSSADWSGLWSSPESECSPCWTSCCGGQRWRRRPLGFPWGQISCWSPGLSAPRRAGHLLPGHCGPTHSQLIRPFCRGNNELRSMLMIYARVSTCPTCPATTYKKNKNLLSLCWTYAFCIYFTHNGKWCLDNYHHSTEFVNVESHGSL